MTRRLALPLISAFATLLAACATPPEDTMPTVMTSGRAARLGVDLRADAASGLLLAELEAGLAHRAFGAQPLD